MAYTDLSLPELRTYTSSVHVPADFDAFRPGTLDEARRHDLAPTFTPVDNRLAAVRTYDVSFAGFGGSRVAGWLHLPASASGPTPRVVQYLGYSGGRGLPHENVLYGFAGYAVFVMDTRGQGGVTADPDAVGPGSPGLAFAAAGLDGHCWAPCPTFRSCATSLAGPGSPTTSRTWRSPAISRRNPTTSSRSSGRSGISTGPASPGRQAGLARQPGRVAIYSAATPGLTRWTKGARGRTAGGSASRSANSSCRARKKSCWK